MIEKNRLQIPSLYELDEGHFVTKEMKNLQS